MTTPEMQQELSKIDKMSETEKLDYFRNNEVTGESQFLTQLRKIFKIPQSEY